MKVRFRAASTAAAMLAAIGLAPIGASGGVASIVRQTELAKAKTQAYKQHKIVMVEFYAQLVSGLSGNG